MDFPSNITYRRCDMMHFDKETMWSFRFEDDPTFKGLYLAGMGVCDDPSCPCAVVTIACRESEPAPGAPEGMPYLFSLDLNTRKIAEAPSREGHPESTKFGRTFVRELDEKNWVQLRDIFLSAKRRLSENLNPDKVKHQFDAREIEDENVTVSYISVLPFADKLSERSRHRNHPPSPPSPAAKAGRNDPCPCGSGTKFKHCCGR
jgi:hypothetical protein